MLELLGISSAIVTSLLLLAAKIILCMLIAKLALNTTRKIIDKSHIETTLARFVKASLQAVIYFVTALIIAGCLGFNITSVIALASVFSAAFALAAQSSLSNLFGGILLLITKPFVVGDYIISSGIEGTVQEVGILTTTLNTVDNKRISIPNGTISTSTITNCSTEGKRRVDIKVTASYDCTVDDVKAAINEAIDNTPMVLEEEGRFVHVTDYGDSAITYTIRVWSKTADYWTVYFTLLENIKVYFDKNNIQMTYNHIIVHHAD